MLFRPFFYKDGFFPVFYGQILVYLLCDERDERVHDLQRIEKDIEQDRLGFHLFRFVFSFCQLIFGLFYENVAEIVPEEL